MSEDFHPPNRGDFARPYHTTSGMPDWFFYASFIVVFVVGILVWRAIRKDEKSGLTKSEREQRALADLLKVRKEK